MFRNPKGINLSDFDVRFLMCMTFLLCPKGGKSSCIFIHPKPKAINVLRTKCRLTLYYSGISFTSFLSLFYRFTWCCKAWPSGMAEAKEYQCCLKTFYIPQTACFILACVQDANQITIRCHMLHFIKDLCCHCHLYRNTEIHGPHMLKRKKRLFCCQYCLEPKGIRKIAEVHRDTIVSSLGFII